MRVSMVSLERRVLGEEGPWRGGSLERRDASEAMVPLERGVRTHPWRAARSGCVAWRVRVRDERLHGSGCGPGGRVRHVCGRVAQRDDSQTKREKEGKGEKRTDKRDGAKGAIRDERREGVKAQGGYTGEKRHRTLKGL
jgi:hypothetical protein